MVLNGCLVHGIFPDDLKIASVCPIFKSGKQCEFSNYHPISISPSISKIFEKIIHKRLINYVNMNKILSSSQYGFRKNYSTYMPILNLYDTVSEALDKNEYCLGIFVDLSKAFDTIYFLKNWLYMVSEAAPIL